MQNVLARYYIGNSGVGGGTPVSLSAATRTAFASTNSAVYITNAVGGTRNFWMEYIRIAIVTAGTALTELRAAIQVDSTNRYSSGGTLGVPSNANSTVASAATPGYHEPTIASVTAYLGSTTLAAATATVVYPIPQTLVRSQIPVIGDTYTFVFTDQWNTANRATNVTPGAAGNIHDVIIPCCPIVLDVGTSVALIMWGNGMTASPTALIDYCISERFRV